MNSKRIQERLHEAREAQGFHLLYACESGSRAWGFASKDSDYDVRFLFAWPQDAYLRIHPPPDVLEYAIDEEAIDLSGWELSKSLRLFQRANAVLFEWLDSPIVYYEDEAWMNRWRTLVPQFFSPDTAVSHYLGLMKRMWFGSLEQGKVTAKKYLYALRAALAAEWVREQRQPIPVAFAELRAGVRMPPEVDREIDRLIAEKANATEKSPIPRNPALDETILQRMEALAAEVERSSPPERPASDPLDALFHDYLAASLPPSP